MKTEERLLARELRAPGRSIKETEQKLSVSRSSVSLFADHVERQREIEDFWLKRLGLGRESLRASTVNTYSKYSQKKRTNTLPYGTAALRVHSTQIVQTIYGSIHEISGFDRPDWLD